MVEPILIYQLNNSMGTQLHSRSGKVWIGRGLNSPRIEIPFRRFAALIRDLEQEVLAEREKKRKRA